MENYYSKKINNSYELSIGYETNNSNTWIKIESGFSAPNASELTDIVNSLYVANDAKYATFITYEIGNKTNITDNLSVNRTLYYTDTKNQSYRLALNVLKNTVTVNLKQFVRKDIELMHLLILPILIQEVLEEI